MKHLPIEHRWNGSHSSLTHSLVNNSYLIALCLLVSVCVCDPTCLIWTYTAKCREREKEREREREREGEKESSWVALMTRQCTFYALNPSHCYDWNDEWDFVTVAIVGQRLVFTPCHSWTSLTLLFLPCNMYKVEVLHKNESLVFASHLLLCDRKWKLEPHKGQFIHMRRERKTMKQV